MCQRCLGAMDLVLNKEGRVSTLLDLAVKGGNKTRVRWQFQSWDEGNVGEGTGYGGNTMEGHLS